MGPELKTPPKNASIMGNVLPPNDSVVHKSQVRVTIFHGRRGRVSFRCSINKSAVVWENEERLPVK